MILCSTKTTQLQRQIFTIHLNRSFCPYTILCVPAGFGFSGTDHPNPDRQNPISKNFVFDV